MTVSRKEVNGMDLRHEWKHEISCCDRLVLRQRLSAVMQLDPHAIDGKYFIRSLYFDNGTDKALREKLDGVNIREKFRIRYYNHDISVIHLEKKSKRSGLGSKETENKARPMIDWIFASEEYTSLYHWYFREFLASVDPLAMIEEAQALIAPYVEKDPTKFCTYPGFEKGVETITAFCRLRRESESDMSPQYWPPGASPWPARWIFTVLCPSTSVPAFPAMP